jgi:hypothetical protein
VHVTHAMAGDKFICQAPGLCDQQRDRREKLRVPIQEFIENIDEDMPEGTAIIDGRLPALPAVRSTQRGAAIFAMRQGRPLLFSPTEKTASTRWRLFDCRYRGIAQNKFCYFIGHVERLGKPEANVHSERTRRSTPKERSKG